MLVWKFENSSRFDKNESRLIWVFSMVTLMFCSFLKFQFILDFSCKFRGKSSIKLDIWISEVQSIIEKKNF